MALPRWAASAESLVREWGRRRPFEEYLKRKTQHRYVQNGKKTGKQENRYPHGQLASKKSYNQNGELDGPFEATSRTANWIGRGRSRTVWRMGCSRPTSQTAS